MVIVLVAATMAVAGPEWRVSIEGQKTGWFAGDANLKGEAHPATPVLDFTLEVAAPRDPQSGLPTGQRQHKPVVFQVLWGAITPQLQQALASNEVLKTVVFEFWKPNEATGVGTMELGEVITLTNAAISGIWHHTLDIAPHFVEVEDVSVTYQKIQIENKKGSTTSQDDWEART